MRSQASPRTAAEHHGVAVPSLDDLILTKRLGGRPKDLEDIRLLEALRSKESE